MQNTFHPCPDSTGPSMSTVTSVITQSFDRLFSIVLPRRSVIHSCDLRKVVSVSGPVSEVGVDVLYLLRTVWRMKGPTSPIPIQTHSLMSLQNKHPCMLVSLMVALINGCYFPYRVLELYWHFGVSSW